MSLKHPSRFLKSSVLVLPLLVFNLSLSGAQADTLPDWSSAGYLGAGVLPISGDITDDAACVITPDELAATYGVTPDDADDDSAGLQAAIDHVRDRCAGDYTSLSLIELPSGTLHTTTEIHVDASFLIIRGQGSAATRIIFEAGDDTVYDDIPDFDLSAMEGPGSANGGWIWPGRGAFRVQTRSVDPDYQEDYENAPANRADFFEGSVNFHWKTGLVVVENSAAGDTTIVLENADALQVGDSVWLGVPNTANMYAEQHVDPDDWSATEFMRQQIFTVVGVRGGAITIDRPLEFDLPHDSTADGSEPIDGQVRDAKVVPLTVVAGVGLENFTLTQVLPGQTPDEAVFNYTNLDPSRAMNGIVFKWAVNSYVRGVHTHMTGSHAVVTEMVRNIQIESNTFEGAWNKGAGGTGYVRISKAWDSLIRDNTLRGMRHLALQWSASHNVVQGNDLDADINLHGGWERYNLIENNIVRVPYEHRNCSPDCAPGDETWYPIWWGAGAHAGDWSGATGPRNVFFNNSLQKQTEPGGSFVDYAPYGSSPGIVFMFGWDRETPEGSHWAHLAIDGTPIDTWTGNEEAAYFTAPHTGVNAQCSSTATSLVDATQTCSP